MSQFTDLPSEITERFLLKLPIEDIKQLCSTNIQVNRICSDDNFWKLLIHRDMGLDVTKDKVIDSYKCLYQLLSKKFFIVTETYNGFEQVDEQGLHNDFKRQSISKLFLTFKEAVDYCINGTYILKIRNLRDPEDQNRLSPQLITLLSDSLDSNYLMLVLICRAFVILPCH